MKDLNELNLEIEIIKKISSEDIILDIGKGMREKYKDIKKANENLKLLMNYEFKTLLLGDGIPILKNAKEAVSDFLSL